MFKLHKLPQALYLKLNQSKEIQRWFHSPVVGTCTKLIADYHESTSTPTYEGWVQYYADVQGWDGTKKAKDEICKVFLDVDPKQISEYVYHRVIRQTWNGHNWELILVNDIQHHFPNLNVTRTAPEIDLKYFIDIELRENDVLILGIQVKPHSYRNMSKPSQLQDKQKHYIGNEEYSKQFNAPYVYVYYNRETGEFYDVEQLFDLIKSLIPNANPQAYKW
jgi:hypothetical protein